MVGVILAVAACVLTAYGSHLTDWSALVLGVLALVLLVCWFVGLVRVTWSMHAAGNETYIMLFWQQSALLVSLAVWAVTVFRLQLPGKGPAAFAFAVAWCTFTNKDTIRDWKKDLGVDPSADEFFSVCDHHGKAALWWLGKGVLRLKWRNAM